MQPNRRTKSFLQCVFVLTMVLPAVLYAGAQADPAVTSASTTVHAQYLYASNMSTDNTRGLISGYRIGSDGKLTAIGVQQISGLTTLVPSTLGAKLFGVGQHKIWVWSVNGTTGALKLLSVTAFPSNQVGLGIGINAQSTFLFIGKIINPGTANEVRRITTYKIFPTGALASVASIVVPSLTGASEAASFVTDPTGRFLYADLSGPTTANSIVQFSINQATGALTRMQTTVLPDMPNLVNIVMHPTGHFLYQGGNPPLINMFSINTTTGALTSLGLTTCNCDLGPDFGRNLAINSTSTLLFEGTDQDGGVAPFVIEQSGKLTPEGANFLLYGSNTYTSSAAGQFLFVTGMDAVIRVFSVGPTGATQPVSGAGVPLPSNMNPLPMLQVVAVRY